jgi:hypothetical protein
MATVKIKVPRGLDPADLEAFQLALTKTRAGDKRQAAQLDDMMRERCWLEVAQFAAYVCQGSALHLKPWQTPPCYVADVNEPRVGEESAAKLLRRMLKAGISRWHPDPLAALEAADGLRDARLVGATVRGSRDAQPVVPGRERITALVAARAQQRAQVPKNGPIAWRLRLGPQERRECIHEGHAIARHQRRGQPHD